MTHVPPAPRRTRVIEQALTGADGSVEIPDVLRGATRTVGKVLGNAPRVVTVVGVEPGDRIIAGSPGGNPTGTR